MEEFAIDNVGILRLSGQGVGFDSLDEELLEVVGRKAFGDVDAECVPLPSGGDVLGVGAHVDVDNAEVGVAEFAGKDYLHYS